MLNAKAPPQPKDVWIDHPLGRLAVRVWAPGSADGSKSPIVLLHDSLGSIDLWRSFPKILSESAGRSVIAYDRLGFGRSDPRHGRLGRDFVAEEAEVFFPILREQLGFDRFILFGHSVGGAMAVHIAARFADSCEALITEAAQAFVEDRTLQGILAAKAAFQQPGQLQRLQKYHGDKARWVFDAWTETWLDPAFAGWNLEAVLPRVKCPVLAIHGAQDEYGSALHPQKIAALVRGPSRCEILANLQHVPHREQERVIVDLMANFLASTLSCTESQGNS